MFKVLDFKIEHLDIVNLRQEERGMLEESDDLLTKLEGLVVLGKVFTVINDGKILAIIGMIKVHLNTHEVFMLPSVYADDYPIALCKVVKRYMNYYAEDCKVRRMQTSAVNDDLHNRWMRWLGFEKEGTMKHYVLDKDYNIWSRFY